MKLFSYILVVFGVLLAFTTTAYASEILFYDTFTAPNFTQLSAHTPDTGTGWTQIINNGVNINSILNIARVPANTLDAGSLYAADTTYNTADYNVSAIVTYSPGGDTYPRILAGRIQDVNNMYALRYTSRVMQIYKRTSGTWSQLTSQATIINGNIGADPSHGETVTLRIDGNTISGLVNDVVITSTTDLDHTLAGKAGMGLGRVMIATDDAGTGIRMDNFTVRAIDSSPMVDTLSPANDAAGVLVDANLVLTFSEAVGAETGTVTIRKASDDSIVETIDVAGGPVSGNGTDTITINPVNDFDPATTYYVEIADTAFRAIGEGEFFAGITGSSTWRFTTAGTGIGRVSATPSSVTLDEGDIQAFGLLLDEPIIGDTEVEIAITSSDTSRATVSVPTVTFLADAWYEAQNFTVTTIDDAIDNATDTVTITLVATTGAEYYNGYQQTITITLNDDDTVGIDAPIPVQVVTEHPTTPIVDLLRFTLESEPLDDVVITPISANGQVEFDPPSITFTPANWDEQQSIATVPIDDDVLEGEHTDTITFTVTSNDPDYDGFPIAAVPVTILDDEQPAPESRSSRSSSTPLRRAAVQEKFEEYYAQQNIAVPTNQVASIDSTVGSTNEGAAETTVQEASDEVLDYEALIEVIENGGLLRLGSTGPGVVALQQVLNARGATPTLVTDGIFGRMTDNAVRAFQAAEQLVVDGIVGAETLARLMQG